MSVRRRPCLPLEQLAPYLLEENEAGRKQTKEQALPYGSLPATGSFLDWQKVFGNDHPVELEVGCGKGLFLLRAAQAYPEINFVGVEIVRKYQLFTATRLAKRGLSNGRVAWADVRLFLPRCVAPASLQAIHVYFPDPWWKRRHHKRRIFTAEFVAECVRVLRPGGQLHAATDVEEYAAVISALLAEQPAFRPLPIPTEREPLHDLDYLTNFERKFRKQGKPIFRISVSIPSSSG